MLGWSNRPLLDPECPVVPKRDQANPRLTSGGVAPIAVISPRRYSGYRQHRFTRPVFSHPTSGAARAELLSVAVGARGTAPRAVPGRDRRPQELAWRRSIAVLEDGAAQPRTLSLFPEDRCKGLLGDASSFASSCRNYSCAGRGHERDPVSHLPAD